jgi:hypothetical protein
MAYGVSLRVVFVTAVVLSSVLQIRHLFMALLLDEIPRRMQEEMIIPFIQEHSPPILLKDELQSRQEKEIGENSSTTETKAMTSSFTNWATKNETSLGPIFYNAYFPAERERIESTLEIIHEQIMQRNETDSEAPILYTLIGNEEVDKYIQKICRPNCTKRVYLEKGDEVDTLQALGKHCQEHPYEIVTYIHDKGSFHPSGANRISRRIGTKAAMECRGLLMGQFFDSENNAPKKNLKDRCSICSYRFYTFPVYHARANMWTAKCSYIRNLLEPRQYKHAVLSMHKDVLNHTILGPTKYACIRPYNHESRFLGVDRFAMERWAFNHPDVQPCDALSKKESQIKKRGKDPITNFKPQLTPSPQRRAITSGIRRIVTSWERLSGRLFEWDFLYQKLPSKSSWVWKYYKGFKLGDDQFLNNCKKLQEETIRNMTLLNVTMNGRPLLDVLREDEPAT